VGVGLVLHEPKTLVDMSKAMDNHHYKFDGTFGPASTNAQIFEHGLHPMVQHLFNTNNRGGHGTCFAYGQTGSGKTVTMMGLGPADRSGNARGLYR
jgi:kinesin family protein 2/24